MCPEYTETELKRLTDEYNRKKEALIKAEKRRKNKSDTDDVLILFMTPMMIIVFLWLLGFTLLVISFILLIWFFYIYVIYITPKKLKKACNKLEYEISTLSISIEKEKREGLIQLKHQKLIKFIDDGDKNLENQNYLIAHQKYKQAIDLANQLENEEIKRKLENKIIHAENEKNREITNQIKRIEKEANKFKDKVKFKNAVLEYQKALKIVNEMFSSDEKKRELKKIKTKINEIYTITIDKSLENANQLRSKKSFVKSIEILNNALEKYKEMYSSPKKDQIKKKIETNFDLTYSDILNERIKRGNKLRKDMKFDNSIRIFKDGLNNVERMYNSSKRSSETSKIKSLIHQAQIAKIKNTILNLGVKFDRLHVDEIAEKCGELEDDIINTALDMIDKKEIYAEYFKSTKSVVFDKQANIDEIDALMEQYKKWEMEGISKK